MSVLHPLSTISTIFGGPAYFITWIYWAVYEPYDEHAQFKSCNFAKGQQWDKKEFETVFFLDYSKLSGPFWSIKITQIENATILFFAHMRNIQTQESNKVGFWFN